MTIWELIIVLWLFCAAISVMVLFKYFRQEESVKKDLMLSMVALLICTLISVIMGPFLVGDILARLVINSQRACPNSQIDEPTL